MKWQSILKSFVIPCSLIGSFALLTVAAETAVPSMTELTDAATAAGEAGNYDKCISILNEAFERHPPSQLAGYLHVLRADAYVHKGEFQRALPDLKQGLKDNENIAKGHYLRGYILDSFRDFDAAVGAYTRAIELDGDFADAFYNRGVDRYARGEVAGALSDFAQTIRINPSFAPAFVNRGTCFLTKEKIDDALKDFAEAIRLDPISLNAYRNRAKAWLAKGEWAKAIEDCDTALRITPQDNDIKQLRAEAVMKQSKR